MDEAIALKRIHALAKTGRLAELRESVGLSQGDVARALAINQSCVSRWESGKTKPLGHNAVRLLTLLDAG